MLPHEAVSQEQKPAGSHRAGEGALRKLVWSPPGQWDIKRRSPLTQHHHPNTCERLSVLISYSCQLCPHTCLRNRHAHPEEEAAPWQEKLQAQGATRGTERATSEAGTEAPPPLDNPSSHSARNSCLNLWKPRLDRFHYASSSTILTDLQCMQSKDFSQNPIYKESLNYASVLGRVWGELTDDNTLQWLFHILGRGNRASSVRGREAEPPPIPRGPQALALGETAEGPAHFFSPTQAHTEGTHVSEQTRPAQRPGGLGEAAPGRALVRAETASRC